MPTKQTVTLTPVKEEASAAVPDMNSYHCVWKRFNHRQLGIPVRAICKEFM